MERVFIVTEYDGTDYVGYQYQDNGPSVQGELQNALTQVYKEEIKVTGCSRTDAGVHARGHVSHFDAPFHIDADRIPYAVNAFLPENIAVKSAYYVSEEKSARFDTKGKRYCYRLYTGRTRSPLLSRYAYYVAGNLDLAKMQSAAEYFAGEHDFASFCASGGSQITTIRRIHEVLVARSEQNPNIIEITVSGEAFLYNMVRIIAGTLLDVGQGGILPEAIPTIINSCDRRRAGRTLPPSGLTLEEVFY